MKGPLVLAVSGASGAGKTTLLVELIPALRARGLAVGALKHSGHVHPFDLPGKDSARLRAAGAVAVALSGPREVAYFGPPRSAVPELVALLPRCDLVLAEGFKGERLPRLEVHRAAIDPRFLCARDPGVVAVVSDVEPPCAVPWFTPGEVEALADLVARLARRGKRAVASRGEGAHRTSVRGDEPLEDGMASRTSRKTGGRARAGARGAKRRTTARRSTAGRRGRSGAATVREAGRKGGRRTLERRGPEFYSRIGRKGGKSSGGSRRAAAAARAGRTGKGRRTSRAR